MTAAAKAEPGFLARVGLAIVHPRWALAVAGDRRHAGRSGTDLILIILIVLAATQLRGLFGAAWLAKDVELGLGLRAVMHLLTRVLTVDLAFLVVGALALWAGAGPKRNLGRAFDLACVAAVPLLAVDLVAIAVIRGFDLTVPAPAGWALAAIAWGWAGALLALAWRPARVAVPAPRPPGEIVGAARRAGVGFVAIAVIGAVFQVLWIARHVETMRPVSSGKPAPAFTLASIGAGGAPSTPYTLAPGKVTVIDFWATWCKPCLQALPKLAKVSRRPDVEVITINLDDAAAARTLFDQLGYHMRLLADDGQVSERYGVTNIPHTVVIDREGIVRTVARGSTANVEGAVDAALAPRLPK